MTIRVHTFLGLCSCTVAGLLILAASAAAAPAAKTKAKKKVVAPTVVAAAPAEPATPPADSSPIAELKKANAQAKKLLQKQRPNWSPEGEHRNNELQKIVDGLLDVEELSRRALARHWDGLTPKQRTEFVTTLRELVNRSYVKQVYGQPDYDLRFDKETKTGNEAVVTGALSTVARGKKVQIALENKMVYKNGHWVVYDLITDEQSLLENYRAQFNKIIAKDGFPELMNRLKKKLQAQNEKNEKK